jgi:hypothetical protein
VNITIHENYQAAGLVDFSVLFYFGKNKGGRTKRQGGGNLFDNPMAYKIASSVSGLLAMTKDTLFKSLSPELMWAYPEMGFSP